MLYTMQKKIRHFRRTIILPVLCLLIVPLFAVASEPGPKEGIQALNGALLDAMKRANELGYAGRYSLLEPVLRNTFDFSFMGMKATGKFWEILNKEQRSLFLKTYTEWSIANYAGNFNGYSGERFELVSESSPKQGIVTVVSKLIQKNEDPIIFHYLMRQIDGRWRVVDIQISGVSQLALTRAQFTDILKNKNFDGLLAMLKEKIAGFAAPKK
jgi:phospholipid transport system substrate-binding protein